MEIKLQFLETNPSINDIKTSSNDIISILILYDSFKIVIPNLEKNISKKEISCINILNAFKKSTPIKLSIFKNSNLIGLCEFNPFNDTKWINISNTSNNLNENKLFINFKNNVKCSMIKNNRNIKEKKHNNLTPKNKKEKTLHQTSSNNNLIQRKLSPKDNNLIISSNKNNKNNRNKSLSREDEINLTDLTTPQSVNHYSNFFKSQSPVPALHYNKIAPKINKKRYSNLRMKTPPLKGKKEEKNTSSFLKNNNKNNSQKIIKIEDMEKYKNFFENNNEKKKLEEEIIDNNFRQTIKNDDIIINDNNININNTPLINNSSFSFSPSDDEISLESNSDLEQMDPCIKIFINAQTDFLIFYTKEYLSSITDDTLSLETQLMIEKIFDLQNIFHKQYNILNKKYNQYKISYETYTERYYGILKKYHRLREKNKKKDICQLRYEVKNPKIKKEMMPGMFKKEIKLWNRMIDDNKKSNLKKSMKKQIFKLFIPILISNKNKLSILQKKFLTNIMEKNKLNNSVTFSDNNNNHHHMKNTFSGDLFKSQKLKSVPFENINSPLSTNRNKTKKIYDDRLLKTYKPKKFAKMLKK